jgi:hypothetical protein
LNRFVAHLLQPFLNGSTDSVTCFSKIVYFFGEKSVGSKPIFTVLGLLAGPLLRLLLLSFHKVYRVALIGGDPIGRKWNNDKRFGADD